MPKKRKAYNKNKQLQRVGDHLCRNLLLVDVPRNDGYVLYHRTRKVLIEPNELVMAAISKPHYWSVSVMVLHKDPITGNNYVQDSGFVAQTRCYPADINELAGEHSVNLHKAMNPNTFVGDAWMASPTGADVGTEEVMYILTKMLAFEPLTVDEELRKVMQHEGRN